MKTKENDFIEIEFIAKTKDNNKIFDLTNEKIAKENNLFQKEKDYSSITICLGKNDVIPGLDKQLINKEIGKHILEIKSDEAFGKKSTDLIKLVPTKLFLEQNIQPIPGLHVNLDNLYGIIKTVSGGRTIVDFNHPLSGKDLIYEVDIKRIVTNKEEKIKAVLNLVNKNTKFELKEDKLKVDLKLNKAQEKGLVEEIKKRIPEIKEVEFEKTTT